MRFQPERQWIADCMTSIAMAAVIALHLRIDNGLTHHRQRSGGNILALQITFNQGTWTLGSSPVVCRNAFWHRHMQAFVR
ncbi:MAG: hypothetical protein PHH58_03735 [Rhodoferax sp.]|nr:hypothetical protein [Rhodoferax sp.]